MGKARVLGGGADGWYQIRIERDLARVQRRIDALTVERGQLAAQITTALGVRTAAAAALLLAEGAAVTAWGAAATAGPNEYQQALQAAGVAELAAQQARAVLDAADAQVSMLRLRDAAAGADIARLSAIPDHVDTAAWCADLTEDLAPDALVGLLVPGDERHTEPPLIRPAYTDHAVYAPARDGILQPAAAATPAGYVLNTMMLPCRQRWKPRHRIGTITALSGDTCSVALDDQRSSQQQLPTVPLTGGPFEGAPITLTGVPIVYMSCNGAAFETGDRVVIAFQNQDPAQPRVIGFHSHPRPCNVNGWKTINRYATVRCDVTETSSDLYVGSTSEMSKSAQFRAVINDDRDALIEYEATGTASLIVHNPGPGAPLSEYRGGTGAVEFDIKAWATINGKKILVYDRHSQMSVEFDTSSGTMSNRTTESTTRKISINYLCETGRMELWEQTEELAVNEIIFNTDPEDPGAKAKTESATLSITSILKHSDGHVYFSNLETVEVESTASEYAPSPNETCWPYVNGSLPTILPPDIVTISFAMPDSDDAPLCGVRPANVNAEIIRASPTSSMSRKRTGIVTGDDYARTEKFFFGASSGGGNVNVFTSPISLIDDMWIPAEYLIDPDDVVQFPT